MKMTEGPKGEGARHLCKRLFLLGFLTLAGCATAQQMQAQRDADDDSTCRGYGAVPGSQAYIVCRMNAANARQAKQAADNAAALAALTYLANQK